MRVAKERELREMLFTAIIVCIFLGFFVVRSFVLNFLMTWCLFLHSFMLLFNKVAIVYSILKQMPSKINFWRLVGALDY